MIMENKLYQLQEDCILGSILFLSTARTAGLAGLLSIVTELYQLQEDILGSILLFLGISSLQIII